jgi:glycosyltransferase involved in cell wall biosynthesis
MSIKNNHDINAKRLLCIVSAMNAGGAETALMKMYRTLDTTKYQMDFYCMSQEEGYYEKEINSMGGKVYHSIPKSENFIKSFLGIKDTVQQNNYNYVIRVSQHSLATLDLVAAKFGGAKVLIQRSSNSDSGSRLSCVLHNIFKWLPMTVPTLKIAPSTEAAKYTFGKNCVKNGEAIIIKNAVPVDKYIFKQEIRDKTRKEFGIKDEFVVGHVGRFNNQKNHSFLIETFSEIVKKHENSILLLVGKGELESNIIRKTEELGLTNKVIFTGVRSDVPDIMMAMDVFVFPSFFEGMPNAVIEAQATGLPCIISDTITKESQITDLVKYLSLNYSPDEWAEASITYCNGFIRKDMRRDFVEKGYDIETVTRQFEKIIFIDKVF